MNKIDQMVTGSGRRYKEDGSVVNIADKIEQMADQGISASIQGTINTKEQPSSSLVAGQNTNVGTTAAAIAGSQAVSEILIQASPTNTVDILLGNSTIQPIRLQPGASLTIPASNINLIFARTASGTAKINWLGRS